MLPKLHNLSDADCEIVLNRFIGGKDKTLYGAFAWGDLLTFRLAFPRTLGVSGVVLRLQKDGDAYFDTPLCHVPCDFLTDLYEVTVDLSTLCDKNGGLFFYEFLFLRGFDTLFSDTADNVTLTLSEKSAEKFRLLVYDRDFHVPEWLSDGVMYHIFVDRFYRDENAPSVKDGAKFNPDWENGIPEYPEKNGDPLENRTFFGGTLDGITEKLDYLSSLGVNILYLSPVFSARSNHRYDTGDYETVDSALGGIDSFERLISSAHGRGMRVILDGVFNHTGDDSRYFNRYGSYSGLGAYQSVSSPYFNWYTFRDFPNDYECWWNIPILPRLNQTNVSCRNYFTGRDGIIARWLSCGADGWRLDVADELPDEFLDELRRTAKETKPDSAVIGEVWERASDKIAYGNRRRYLSGRQLDSVMNYPFRSAVLSLLHDRNTAKFVRILTDLYASYPRFVSDSLMNLLGTHDTARILTLLGDETAGEGKTNAELAVLKLSPEQYAKGVNLLKIASTLQFTVYGFPSVFYGDEVGTEGYGDPFCRRPFPWGHENTDLLGHYRKLASFRSRHTALHGGDFRFLSHNENCFLFERKKGNDRILVAVNVGGKEETVNVGGSWQDSLSGKTVQSTLTLSPLSACLLEK